MTPEERRARAVRVRELLDSDDIKDAFENAKAQFRAQWEICQSAEERENLWRAVHILRLVQANLAQFAVLEVGQIDTSGATSAIRRA